MRRLLLGTLVGVVSMAALETRAHAAAPELVNFQGKLTDTGGVPVDGTADIVFSIYELETGGTPVWTQAHAGVQVTDGLFTVLLGGGAEPITPTVLQSGTCWLEMTVGGELMSPRQRIVSVAYAQVAAHSETADTATTAATATTAGDADTVDGKDAADLADAVHEHDADYVNVTGDTMVGTLNLPADGLVAGTSQLVLSGGNVGVGIASPTSPLTVAGIIEMTSGAIKFSDGSVLSSKPNMPPVAMLIATRYYFTPQPEVYLNANQSYDPEGLPLSYEWSVMGGWPFTAGGPTLTYRATGTGYSLPTVRVSDQIGQQAESKVLVKLPRGNMAGPLVVEGAVDMFDALPGRHVSLASIRGRPAVSYRHKGGAQLRYAIALSADGTQWSSYQVESGTVDTDGQHCSLAEVAGSPAIACRWYHTAYGWDVLMYFSAAGSDGSGGFGWAVVDNNMTPEHISLAVAYGRPAISYCDGGSLKFAICASPFGGDIWTDLDLSPVNSRCTSLATVNGRAAIAGRDTGCWFMIHDGTSTGDDAADFHMDRWTKVDVPGTTGLGDYCSLGVVDGRAAIAIDRVGFAIHDGTSTGEDVDDFAAGHWGVTVTAWTDDKSGVGGEYTSLAVVDDRAAVARVEAGDVEFSIQDGTCAVDGTPDFSGGGWDTTVVVSPADARYTSLADINARAAIAYYDFTDMVIKFVMSP